MGGVRETFTNDCFDLKVRLQADFVLEIGSYYLDAGNASPFLSLSLFFCFFLFLVCFFLVLFLFLFLWCINGSPSARLHNIALVAMHGSNYLLLMDIPQPRGGGPQSFSCFCPVKPFFFSIIFSLFIERTLRFSSKSFSLFLFSWYFIDESRQSLKGPDLWTR